jgi:hypothetical protein
MKVNPPKKLLRFPKIIKVQARTISQELVSIKPMDKPPMPLDDYLKKLGLLE